MSYFQVGSSLEPVYEAKILQWPQELMLKIEPKVMKTQPTRVIKTLKKKKTRMPFMQCFHLTNIIILPLYNDTFLKLHKLLVLFQTYARIK